MQNEANSSTDTLVMFWLSALDILVLQLYILLLKDQYFLLKYCIMQYGK